MINGFQRGGTNILWNILQSHPSVCAPLYETGEILRLKHKFHKYPVIDLILYIIVQKFIYSLLQINLFIKSPFFKIIGKWVDSIFFKLKINNLAHIYNKFKYENVIYTQNEVENSHLCLKSVNRDILLTKYLSYLYKNIYFIGLIRNGYALLESWNRRGFSPTRSAKIYRKYCIQMLRDQKKCENYIIIKFEDLLKNSFEVAKKLYKFAKLRPINLEKIRLQSKKVLSKEGRHSVIYGRENVNIGLIVMK